MSTTTIQNSKQTQKLHSSRKGTRSKSNSRTWRKDIKSQRCHVIKGVSRRKFIKKAANNTGLIIQFRKNKFKLIYKKDHKVQSVIIQSKHDGLHLTGETKAFKSLNDTLAHVGVKYLHTKGAGSEEERILLRAEKDLENAEIATVKQYSRKNNHWQEVSYIAVKKSDGVHLYKRQHKKEHTLPNRTKILSHSAPAFFEGQERFWKGTDQIRSNSTPLLLGSMKANKDVTVDERAVHQRFSQSERLNTTTEFTTSKGKTKFITDRMGGDLQQALDLTLEQKLPIFLEVCKGVKELHDAGVIHRDLKLDNIFIDLDKLNPGKSKVQIGDFGQAVISYKLELEMADTKENQAKTYKYPTPLKQAGTPLYNNPKYGFFNEIETLEEGKANDIHALGILLYFLVKKDEKNDKSKILKGEKSGHFIDPELVRSLAFNKDINDKKSIFKRNNKKSLNKNIENPNICNIIAKMACFEELGQKRLTINDVINEIQKLL
jgi:serine/threonine protein kinase